MCKQIGDADTSDAMEWDETRATREERDNIKVLRNNSADGKEASCVSSVLTGGDARHLLVAAPMRGPIENVLAGINPEEL